MDSEPFCHPRSWRRGAKSFYGADSRQAVQKLFVSMETQLPLPCSTETAPETFPEPIHDGPHTRDTNISVSLR
jgi:hypothetical protein